MRKILKRLAISVLLLTGAFTTFYASQVLTTTKAAQINVEQVGDSSLSIRITYPALMEKEDFDAINTESQEAVVQKLACFMDSTKKGHFDSEAATQALKAAPKTVSGWNEALRSVPQCPNIEVSRVKRTFYLLTAKPWYEPAENWRNSTLRGDNMDWRYQQNGWGTLAELAEQATRVIPTKVPETVDSSGTPLTWKRVDQSLRNYYYTNSQLDSSTVNEVIAILQKQQCTVIELPQGFPIYKNTGVGVVGHKELFKSDKQVRAAVCQLKSGRYLMVSEVCTNLDYPLTVVEYTYTATIRRPTIAKTPFVPNSNTKLPPTRDRSLNPGIKYGIPGLIAAGLIGAFLLHQGGGDNGNKPIGAPPTRYNLIPISH